MKLAAVALALAVTTCPWVSERGAERLAESDARHRCYALDVRCNDDHEARACGPWFCECFELSWDFDDERWARAQAR